MSARRMASCQRRIVPGFGQVNFGLSQHGGSLVDCLAGRGRRRAAGIDQRGLGFRGGHHLIVLLARDFIFGDERLVAGDIGLSLGAVGFCLAQVGFSGFIVALRSRRRRLRRWRDPLPCSIPERDSRFR